jgi:hypothetical protein
MHRFDVEQAMSINTCIDMINPSVISERSAEKVGEGIGKEVPFSILSQAHVVRR